MRHIGFLGLIVTAGMLALASCESTPLETETEAEVEEAGYLYHIEFNRTQVAGEEVVATMWVLLRREDVIPVAEGFLEDSERLGAIWGEVHPGPGVDPNVEFHFDPDGTVLFPVGHPADICVTVGPSPYIVEAILDGRLSRLCANRIRVLDFLPASAETEL
jgi:hypothetical protein